jgi:hypothetical protein
MARKVACFVSAPQGSDTSVLLDVLRDEGVRATGVTQSLPGFENVDSVRRELQKADCACVVLTPDHQNEVVFLELGIALGLKIPTLVVAPPNLRTSFDLASLPVVRADLSNVDALRLHVKTFIRGMTERSHRRATKLRPKASPRAHVDEQPSRLDDALYTLGETDSHISAALSNELENLLHSPPFVQEERLEQLVMSALQESDILIQESRKDKTRGFDAAIWLEGLRDAVKNPVIIELKVGKNLTQPVLDKYAIELRRYIDATAAGAGLLVYWNQAGENRGIEVTRLPDVFRVSVSHFIDLLISTGLAKAMASVHRRALQEQRLG